MNNSWGPLFLRTPLLHERSLPPTNKPSRLISSGVQPCGARIHTYKPYLHMIRYHRIGPHPPSQLFACAICMAFIQKPNRQQQDACCILVHRSSTTVGGGGTCVLLLLFSSVEDCMRVRQIAFLFPPSLSYTLAVLAHTRSSIILVHRHTPASRRSSSLCSWHAP